MIVRIFYNSYNERRVVIMKHYFIGVDKRSEELIMGLINLGCGLMFYYHPKTIELNLKYEFYDGEWLFRASHNDSEIDLIKKFLEYYKSNNNDLKFKIISD